MLVKFSYKNFFLYFYIFVSLNTLANEQNVNSRLLDDEKENFTIINSEEGKMPKSKLIDDKEEIEEEMPKKPEKKIEIIKKEKVEKNEKKSTKQLIEKKTNSDKNKSNFYDEKIIKILFLPDATDISDDESNTLNKKIAKINKDKRITIRSYSSKVEEKTTSFARRLSLSRALKVRNILLNLGFSNTNVFVRALGTEKPNSDSQDIIILDIN